MATFSAYRQDGVAKISGSTIYGTITLWEKVCDHYFERRNTKRTSHRTYKTPWLGDPRVNIQNAKGKAKPYQVHQVLEVIEKLGAQKKESE
ncbi:toxin HicA [Corynebacterium pseudodiphtheriticum]|nr:MAG: toxin HicA [Corynebacterium propinquum]RUP90850.1 toxin HicA [Corynebacterium pseudodiphtheriticum]RUP92576.1 toxin HicA [Corynebacterium pseudodiphtheriticum]RUP97383.1 toxin HicA [Corynebacterium pseudodiphtheriticum]RUQ00368.1 toxin HicA [Corynebacterium pseudodiphtheriticum]